MFEARFLPTVMSGGILETFKPRHADILKPFDARRSWLTAFICKLCGDTVYLATVELRATSLFTFELHSALTQSLNICRCTCDVAPPVTSRDGRSLEA